MLGCIKIKSRGSYSGLKESRRRVGSARSIRPAAAHQSSVGRKGVVIEARVRTLNESAKDVYADIQINHRSVAKHGLRGTMHTALRPWLGDTLLSKGLIVYMHLAGRVEVVTKATPLEDVIDAEAIDIVVQAEAKLPSTSARRAGAQDEVEYQDDEGEPMFRGWNSLGAGTFVPAGAAGATDSRDG